MNKNALIITLSHCSEEIPANIRRQSSVDPQTLKSEAFLKTDRHVESEFANESFHELVRQKVSPLVIDSTKPRTAIEKHSPFPMKCADGQRLRRALSQTEKQEILDNYYDDLHEQVAHSVSRVYDNVNVAMILNCRTAPARHNVMAGAVSIESGIRLHADAHNTPAWMISWAINFWENVVTRSNEGTKSEVSHA